MTRRDARTRELEDRLTRAARRVRAAEHHAARLDATNTALRAEHDAAVTALAELHALDARIPVLVAGDPLTDARRLVPVFVARHGDTTRLQAARRAALVSS